MRFGSGADEARLIPSTNIILMRENRPINHCTFCGNKVVFEIPEGDNRPRHVCRHCGQIQYQNPRIVTGCIPVWEDRILLCKRAIEPRLGYWTIPAGFMENGETVEQGAMRETREEACAKVTNPSLYQIYNVTSVNQIYMLFRAQLEGADQFDIGQESLEVELVEESRIPWHAIAFKVVHNTLQRFFEEREQGRFEVRIDTI